MGDAGCYEDIETNRMLTGKSNDNIANARPKQCRIFCEGFKYFAVENTNQCFCGNYLSHLNKKPESECDKPCPADNARKCGGLNRLNLYRTAPAPFVVTSVRGGSRGAKFFGLEGVTMPEM